MLQPRSLLLQCSRRVPVVLGRGAGGAPPLCCRVQGGRGPGWSSRGLATGGSGSGAGGSAPRAAAGAPPPPPPTASAAAARAEALRERNSRIALYALSVVIGVGGVSYAAVPLYKAFCQATGFGGTTQVATREKADSMTPVEGARPITVTFDGMTADTMPWRFRQAQAAVRVVPGETALAFYTAANPTDKHITGVATYNVYPLKAGIYFNKIQCFCFEEQRLRAGEEIDMPVLFFIDPEILDDPAMDNVTDITLAYTFFKTGEEEPEEEEDAADDYDDDSGGGGWRWGGWGWGWGWVGGAWRWLRGGGSRAPPAAAGDVAPAAATA